MESSKKLLALFPDFEDGRDFRIKLLFSIEQNRYNLSLASTLHNISQIYLCREVLEVNQAPGATY